MGFIHTMAIPGSKVFWLLLAILGVIIHVYAEDYSIGIDYGQLGDNLPSTEEAIHFIQIMKAGRVKLYDANPEILKSLSHTGIKVSVMVKNEDIANVSASQSVADKWVKNNVVYFYPATKINIVLVGNEILSDYSSNQTWYQLVPAMLRIRRALLRYKLHHIKVGTPLAMDVLNTSFPPSSGAFRADVAETVMKPMLEFLTRTKSYFFIDVYPLLGLLILRIFLWNMPILVIRTKTTPILMALCIPICWTSKLMRFKLR